MSTEGPMGTKGRFAAKEGTGAITWASAASFYEFLNEDITDENEIAVSQGITGDRSQRKERAQQGPYKHGGTVRFHMSAGDSANWLKWATGGTPSGSTTITYPLATSLVNFGVLIDKVTNFTGLTSAYEVLNAQVDRLMIHGIRRQQDGDGPPEPDFIEMAVRLFGLSSSAGTQTFPTFSLGATEAYRPYEMSGLTINLASSTVPSGQNREIKEFWFLLDNNLYQRYVNSLHPTAIYPQGFRSVMLQVRVPYDNDHDDLYDQQLSYGAGTLTLANSTFNTAISMPALHAPRNTPAIVGKTEIDMTLRLAARKSGSTDECSIANKAA